MVWIRLAISKLVIKIVLVLPGVNNETELPDGYTFTIDIAYPLKEDVIPSIELWYES